MRRPTNSLPLLLLAALAASCDSRDAQPGASATPAQPSGAPGPSQPGKTPAKTAVPAARQMPQMPPLTEATAKAVFASQVAALDADDASREALLYMADLGDRSCLDAVRRRLLARKDDAFADATAAAIGAEALIAFGEKDGATAALAAAKQYAAEEQDPDEYLLHALARVQGEGRAEALRPLLDTAGGDDDTLVPLAVQLLAEAAAPEARDLFARIAQDAERDEQLRGTAAAGLLRLKDAKAAEIADRLIHDATTPAGDAGLDPQYLLPGFGVEGAVEASPFVRKLVEGALAVNDASTTFMMDELAPALGAIHRREGGADLVPWLREIGKRNEEEYSEETALALWTLGDDSHAAKVAKQLEDMVAQWSAVANLESAVDILDTAARRGVAAKEPFRRIVDSAAQIQPPSGAVAANGHLRSLNLAAAHAFLKSSK